MVLLAAMVLIIVIARRAVGRHMMELFALLRTRTVLTGSLFAATAVVAILGIAAAAPSLLLPVAVFALLASVGAAMHSRRAAKMRLRADA